MTLKEALLFGKCLNFFMMHTPFKEVDFNYE